MPKTQTKNPNLIIKILSDLNLLPEKGEDVNEKSYLRALMEGVNILSIEALSRPGRSDPRVKILQDEVRRVRADRKAADIKFKEKRTTIKGDKFMGKEPKKDAPPTADKPKLLTGVGNFKSDDVKPVDVEKKEGDAPALMPDRLDSIANTVDSIALLLRRQFKLETKQQRDAKIKQDKDAKDSREDDLEKKPKDKKTGLIPNAIKKPALSFFEKLKKFFLNIVIGAGAIKLMEWLKDPANAEKITKFKDFLINNAGWILGGLAAIALLPIALSLVSVVQGVLAGLSLLGPLLPALPLILGGLLVGAVAWWIGKKISRAITGGQVIGKERKENVKRLRAAGIVDAKENSLTLINEKGTGRMKVNMYGENSITGREAIPGKENKNARVNLDLMVPEHAEWYVKNYGQEALDEKLAAHKSFRDTKASLIDAKKDMQGEIKELWKDKKKDHFAEVKAFDKTDASDEDKKAAWKEARKAWYGEDGKGGIRAELQQKEADVRKKYGDIAVEIGDESEADLKAEIDPNTKANNIVPGPSTVKNGGVTIVDGGGTGTGTVGSSGGSGDSDDGDDNFSSEDPNDASVLSSKSTYNMGG